MMGFLYMMKFIGLMLSMFILYKYKMFYYNLCFLMSFLMLFIYSFKYDSMDVGYYMKWDSFSYFLSLLSIWIIGVMYMSIMKEFDNLKIFMFNLMLIILFVGFLMKNLLMFYFFFEISLIPTFIMVVYWGNNPERLMAGFYMLMYTMLISMPFLVYLLMIFVTYGSLDMYLCMFYVDFKSVSIWQYIMLILAFLIKMPLYLFHLWLPKAHVEAPVYGSMILAGVLLKLGSYGLLRLLWVLKLMKYNYYFYMFSVIGGIIISLVCLVQVDMKMLVAYSSVVHMNMMLSSMMTMSKLAMVGAIVMMIAHGLCSSGMFYMVNLFYIRTGSRMMLMNKGMINIMPSMMLLWFILCIMNFSFPLSLNFIGEIFLMMSIIMWDMKMIIFLMIMSFLSSAYSLYLFSYVFHGEVWVGGKFNSGNLMEYLVIIIHFIPLLMMLLNLILFS